MHRPFSFSLLRWLSCAVVTAFVLACGGQSAPPGRIEPLVVGGVGRVVDTAFESRALGVAKHFMLYLPPSYGSRPAQRYPVVYYLHGLGGAEGDWVTRGGIAVAADSLIAAGGPEMILVMPDGDDGWYTTWSRQISYRTCADTQHNEPAERYCVATERYDEYVARDLVEYVDSHFRTKADRAHRGIGGLSMGGYGAISLALHFPQVFAAAASHSGVLSPMLLGPKPAALPIVYPDSVSDPRLKAVPFFSRYQNYWGTEISRWRDADPAHAVDALLKRHTLMPAMFIDCGVDDPYLEQSRAFHLELGQLGISHMYAEWPGAHTWPYWSTHVRESLAWMGKQVGGR